MTLPFLPPEHIVPVFQHLEQKAICDLLCNFIWRQRITNSVFPVQNWSVFMLSLRTNNDLEGWHNRLNRHVNQQGPEPFYLLLTELYKESEKVPAGKTSFREHNGKLSRKWEEISTTKLLRHCASLNGPVPV